MRYALIVFWFILGFLILWIFSLNLGQTVKLDLMFTEFENISVVSLIIASLFTGFVIGVGILTIKLIQEKKFSGALKKKLMQIQGEEKKNRDLSKDSGVQTNEADDA